MPEPTSDTRTTMLIPSTSTEGLHTAAAILRSGGLVAFPTETVYGLGANALSASAVASIFTAKGRPSHNPLIVHIAGQDMRNSVIAAWPPAAQRLADRFWPGPLTLVLPKKDTVPTVVTGGGSTVAIRWPAHPVALELIRLSGVPLAAPSANRSTEISPTRAEHVQKSLGGRIDMIVDGGPTTAGIESTVLDLTTPIPTLLRPGPIPLAELEALLGPVQRIGQPAPQGPLPSPGLLARHYAPRTPTELFDSADAVQIRQRELHMAGERVALLSHLPMSFAELMPNDPTAYAAILYETLHRLDESNQHRLLILLPPDTPEWLAVRDRLKRAGTWMG